MDFEGEYTTALAKAMATWQSGRQITLTLAAELMEQGYDIPMLEHYYSKM